MNDKIVEKEINTPNIATYSTDLVKEGFNYCPKNTDLIQP